MYVFVDKGTIQIKIQLTYQFASFKKKIMFWIVL